MKGNVTAALFALAFSASAHAHDLDVAATQSIPAALVADLESIDGEGKTEFVKRIAEVATGYTREHGHEVCGWIAYGGRSAFSIRLVTLGSQIACGAAKGQVVDGYSAGNELLHSHPEKRVLRLTALDRKLRGRTQVGANTESPDNCRFSDTDYANPGYLVACGKILHQKGRGTVTQID
jgi:hypothetical protein